MEAFIKWAYHIKEITYILYTIFFNVIFKVPTSLQNLNTAGAEMTHLNAYLQSNNSASFSQILAEGTTLPNLSLSGGKF